MPKRRKRLSPIGLAMLDLISNSLAATIILFIILASLRKPFIIPERINGTLFVRYELVDTVSYSVHPSSSIWIDPPLTGNENELASGVQRVFFGAEQIGKINRDPNGQGFFTDCEEIERKLRKGKRLIPPCAMVYSPIDSPHVHYLIIRDPLPGLWKTGIIYEDHANYEKEAKAVKASMKAWFIASQEGELSTLPQDSILVATTTHAQLVFETPNWAEL